MRNLIYYEKYEKYMIKHFISTINKRLYNLNRKHIFILIRKLIISSTGIFNPVTVCLLNTTARIKLSVRLINCYRNCSTISYSRCTLNSPATSFCDPTVNS
ncbi:hypothetical protein PUN28_001307 [Cardiocondyla obscurior]|uniref:Uncharacterized protein n=1 Tax=Cardiocondyla obscurior TaxID=286306 RepID=A0AAW2H517_9HYME